MHGHLNVKIMYFILVVFVIGLKEHFNLQHEHIAPWDCDINIMDQFWKLLLIRILSHPKCLRTKRF